MIVSLIFVLLMSMVVLIFCGFVNNFSPASIVYSVFLISIFTAITFSEYRKKGSGSKYRTIFQVVFSVFFTISFIMRLIDERGSMTITSAASVTGEIPFCHIAIPQVLIPFLTIGEIIFPARITNHYASVASMLCIWFAATIFLGRGWCSWVCFYGGWEEGFSHLAKKRKIKLLSHNKEIRESQFAFFAFIALASLSLMTAIYCKWFCPFKAVTEYSPFDSVSNVIAGIIFIALFLGLVVILPLLSKRRTQCSSLCPFGALASLTNGISLFKVKIDTDKCKGCLKCADICPFGSIDIQTIKEKKGKPEITCAKCGECIKVCSEKAISFAFRFENSKCRKHEAKTFIGRGVQNFLDPAALFRFSAFTFGVVMSSSFGTDTIRRIIGLFI